MKSGGEVDNGTVNFIYYSPLENVMPKTITINQDIFQEMIKKKEEFDAIVESIELMNNPEVKEAIKKSKEDIRTSRVHNLRDVLKR